MKSSTPPIRSWWWLLITMNLAVLHPLLPQVRAQESASPDPQVSLELDLNALLLSDKITVDQLEDAIWIFAASPGKRLVQLPLIVGPSRQPVELTTSLLSMRGGRFLAWRLMDDLEKAPEGSAAAEKIEKDLGNDIPRFTRAITVLPNGNIRWSMDRRMFGGEIKPSDRLYVFKLDSQALAAKSPGEPPRFRSGDPNAAAAIAEFRARNNAYRELRSAVIDLPTEFEEPMPKRVWAVFELNQYTDTIDVSGPAPFPWKLSLAGVQMLHRASKPVTVSEGAMGAQIPTDMQNDLATLLEAVTQEKHPYNIRLAAFVLSMSGVVRYAQPGDTIFQLCQLILASDDDQSRRTIAKELISTIPPTAASRQLLAVAGQDLLSDASIQRERLKNLLQLDSSDPRSMQETLATANRILADPQGPPPVDVLRDLLQAAQNSPETIPVLTNGIQFNALEHERLDQVIAYIIEQAGTHPLAANWFSLKLLGAPQPELMARTLTILNAADRGSPAVREGLQSFVSLVFGPSIDSESQSIPRPQIASAIVIDSPQHSIYKALQHGNEEIRDLAWQVLPHFVIPAETDDGSPASGAGAQGQFNRYSLLIDAALIQGDTPSTVVDFLIRQPDQHRATLGLVQIMMRGSNRASLRASRALLGSNRPLDQILTNDLSWGDRHGFARQLYNNITKTAPLVAGLMRDRNQSSEIASWFGKQVAAGHLPEPYEWVEGAGGEDRVYEYVVSSDPDLARAAVAALVATAGGDDRMAYRIAQQFADSPEQTVTAFRDSWNQIKRKMYFSNLARRAGSYRMLLLMGHAGQTPPMTPNGEQVSFEVDRTISVGLVQLDVGDSWIRLANGVVKISVPDDGLYVQLDSVSDLKNLPHNELNQLPLEQVEQPAEFVIRSDNTWHARFTLPDGTPAELVLEPVK